MPQTHGAPRLPLSPHGTPVPVLCTPSAMTAEAVCTAEDGVRLQGRGGVPRVLSLPCEDQHVSCAVQ